MTPKEKANELVDKYWLVESDNYSALYIDRSMGKKCALIAVDELIESHLVLSTTHDLKPSIRCKRYWQEVKQEIEKL